MRTYLDLFDLAVGVFVLALLTLIIGLIAYGILLMWRLLHDAPRTDEPPADVASDEVEYAEAQASYDIVEEAELIVEQYNIRLGKEQDSV